MTAALPEYDPEELKRRYGPQLDAAVAPLTPPPAAAAAAEPPASLAPPPGGPSAAAPPAQGFATGPWPVRGEELPPGSPAAGEELPPAPPPRRGAIDPGLASFLQRGSAAPATAATAAPAQDEQAPPVNVRRKVLEVIDAVASGLGQHRSGRAFDPGYWQGLDEADRAEALRKRALVEADPASEPSAAARRSMAPALKSMGLTDAEIGTMSAADIKALGKGGNLVMGLVKVRAKAKADADARALKLQDEAAARDAAQKEWDRQHAITAPEHEKNARIMAGMATGRMIQGALLQDELQSRRQEEQASRQAAIHEAEQSAEEQRKIAGEQRTAEQKEADEVVALQRLRKQLATREPGSRLPGQKNALEQAVIDARGKIEGEGAGMSPDDASLNTDLTSLGLQAYMNKAHNAPNSAREQEVANGLFRGNGTVQSALDRVDQRIKEIHDTRSTRAASSSAGKQPAAKAPATGMVRVRDPKSGAVRDIPAANAEKAKQRGLEVIGG